METLPVSGSVDFATPAEYVRDELLPALSSEKQVILAEMGHINDVISLQSETYERLISTFCINLLNNHPPINPNGV